MSQYGSAHSSPMRVADLNSLAYASPNQLLSRQSNSGDQGGHDFIALQAVDKLQAYNRTLVKRIHHMQEEKQGMEEEFRRDTILLETEIDTLRGEMSITKNTDAYVEHDENEANSFSPRNLNLSQSSAFTLAAAANTNNTNNMNKNRANRGSPDSIEEDMRVIATLFPDDDESQLLHPEYSDMRKSATKLLKSQTKKQRDTKDTRNGGSRYKHSERVIPLNTSYSTTGNNGFNGTNSSNGNNSTSGTGSRYSQLQQRRSDLIARPRALQAPVSQSKSQSQSQSQSQPQSRSQSQLAEGQTPGAIDPNKDLVIAKLRTENAALKRVVDKASSDVLSLQVSLSFRGGNYRGGLLLYICVLSYFMWSSALDSSGILLL